MSKVKINPSAREDLGKLVVARGAVLPVGEVGTSSKSTCHLY